MMDDSELHNSLVALHSASFAWATNCCHDRELADEDELSMIRAALGDLPQRKRQIAHLVFYEDLTVDAPEWSLRTDSLLALNFEISLTEE